MILDIHVDTHVSYVLPAFNNAITITGKHTFYIIGMCPGINLSATLHMYALFYCYFSLHIDLKLLHL